MIGRQGQQPVPGSAERLVGRIGRSHQVRGSQLRAFRGARRARGGHHQGDVGIDGLADALRGIQQLRPRTVVSGDGEVVRLACDGGFEVVENRAGIVEPDRKCGEDRVWANTRASCRANPDPNPRRPSSNKETPPNSGRVFPRTLLYLPQPHRSYTPAGWLHRQRPAGRPSRRRQD